MAGQRFFVAQFVVVLEDRWFAPGVDGPPVRVDRRYRIAAQLFTACDEEEAYRTACEWLAGFSDSSHDGPGDLFVTSAIGIHQIEAVTPPASEFVAAAKEMYGVDVGEFDPNAVDADGVPLIRAKADLDVFKTFRATSIRSTRPHVKSLEPRSGGSQ